MDLDKTQLVITVSGASASIREYNKTLPGFAEDVLCDNYNYKHLLSTDSRCAEDVIELINRTYADNVLLVGKSLGAVRVWWAIYNYWGHMQAWLNSNRNHRLNVLLLDPHGPQRGDKRVGWYGCSLDELGYHNGWSRRDMSIACIRQRNDRPKGAKIQTGPNVTNLKLGPHADHWNITRNDNRAGRQVASALRKLAAFNDWMF